MVVLLHGLASSSATWAEVMPLLGRHVHVIAPDLLGHGRSAKPRSGDHSSTRTPPPGRAATGRPDLDGPFSALGSFGGGGARGAFVQTARGALDGRRQRLAGTERLHLLAEVPVLLVGGRRDLVIPVAHTAQAHEAPGRGGDPPSVPHRRGP